MSKYDEVMRAYDALCLALREYSNSAKTDEQKEVIRIAKAMCRATEFDPERIICTSAIEYADRRSYYLANPNYLAPAWTSYMREAWQAYRATRPKSEP